MLAEIETEGVEKMAAYLLTPGGGTYEEYSEWAEKLYSVYEEESEKITDYYLNSLS